MKLEKNFSELLWLGISLYQSFQSNKICKTNGITYLDAKVRYYISRFCEVCGNQREIESRVGTKLTKLHALIHLVQSIKKYGIPNNFFGGFLESMLKTFVKHPSKRTRKMPGDLFLLDLCNRWSEREMIKDYVQMNNLSSFVPNILSNSGTNNCTGNHHTSRVGNTKYYFENINGTWHTCHKNHFGHMIYSPGIFHPYHKLDNKLLSVLQQWVNIDVPSLCQDSSIPKITCHYEFNKQCESIYDNSTRTIYHKYRSSPSYRGSEWFDWVNIEYENRHSPTDKYKVPSKLFLVMKLCYDDDVEDDGDVDSDSSDDDVIDDYIYALVWPMASTITPTYPLLDCFGYDKLYSQPAIWDINKVKGPAFVIPAVNYKKMEVIMMRMKD